MRHKILLVFVGLTGFILMAIAVIFAYYQSTNG